MTGEELKQQIALYESADHTVHLDVKVDEDTVWLNRQQLALLFGRDIKTIGKHVGNALREAQWIFSCRKICDNCI